MKAAAALRTARAASVEITLDGDDLILEASSPPPEPVLDALSRNKARIVALLCQRMDEPSSGDIVVRALPRLWRGGDLPGDPLLPHGTATHGQACLHSRCWPTGTMSVVEDIYWTSKGMTAA